MPKPGFILDESTYKRLRLRLAEESVTFQDVAVRLFTDWLDGRSSMVALKQDTQFKGEYRELFNKLAGILDQIDDNAFRQRSIDSILINAEGHRQMYEDLFKHRGESGQTPRKIAR